MVNFIDMGIKLLSAYSGTFLPIMNHPWLMQDIVVMSNLVLCGVGFTGRAQAASKSISTSSCEEVGCPTDLQRESASSPR